MFCSTIQAEADTLLKGVSDTGKKGRSFLTFDFFKTHFPKFFHNITLNYLHKCKILELKI